MIMIIQFIDYDLRGMFAIVKLNMRLLDYIVTRSYHCFGVITAVRFFAVDRADELSIYT